MVADVMMPEGSFGGKGWLNLFLFIFISTYLGGKIQNNPDGSTYLTLWSLANIPIDEKQRTS